MRSRLILILIVYFLGFSTAVYLFGPMPDAYAGQSGRQSIVETFPQSQEYLISFNIGLHKCVDFVKEVSIKAGEYVKEKIDEKQTSS